MKRINIDRNAKKAMRQKRSFKKIKLIANDRPRLLVNKTNSHIFVQLIDVNLGKTLASSSSLILKLTNGNKENCKKVGKDIGNKILKLGIKEVAFDRGGSKYHGRILEVANAARETGLKF